MNAGKFTGGTNYVNQTSFLPKIEKKREKTLVFKVIDLKLICQKYKKRIVKRLCQEL